MQHLAKLAAVLVGACLASSAWAQNGAPSGPHYNLNIIGVENAKNPPMAGSDRHTIFVPLFSTKNNGQVSTCNATSGTLSGSCTAIVDNPIWLIPGVDFQVCDGNAFDPAHDCSGNLLNVNAKLGAVFSLPCNTAISQTADINVPCDPNLPAASYTVWARALGKPGGHAEVTTCATVDGGLFCSLENVTQPLMRNKGQPVFQNVTDQLTSMLVLFCDTGFLADGTCSDPVQTERIALFASGTQDWFWNYDNTGLRLAQLRFYMN
jgi:hypothetical protein